MPGPQLSPSCLLPTVPDPSRARGPLHSEPISPSLGVQGLLSAERKGKPPDPGGPWASSKGWLFGAQCSAFRDPEQGAFTHRNRQMLRLSHLIFLPTTVPGATPSHILGEETEAPLAVQEGEGGHGPGHRAGREGRVLDGQRDRCARPRPRPRRKSAANLSPAGPLRGVMDGLRPRRLLRNHSVARQALNLTQGVLKGGMSVFITYLSYNKYLKCALTSSRRTIGLCGPGRQI